MLFDRSRDARVRASRSFSSTSARLVPAGGGRASGCSFGARELASVSLFYLWTGDAGVALWQRTPHVLCPFGSPSSSLYVRRGDGVGE